MPTRREPLKPHHDSTDAMIRARYLPGWVLCAAGAAASAGVLAPGSHVADFTLSDQTGATHHLYALAGKKAVVVMTQSNGCPIVRLAVPALRDIRERYRSQGVEFLLLNPTLQDTGDAVQRETEEFAFDMTVLLDRSQQIGEAWGVTRTAEVFVIDPKTWTLMYHGPIDDRLNYESQRPVHHPYLTDALDAVLANKPVTVTSVVSPGCLINFPHRKPSRS
jgi:peroxiredoxin